MRKGVLLAMVGALSVGGAGTAAAITMSASNTPSHSAAERDASLMAATGPNSAAPSNTAASTPSAATATSVASVPAAPATPKVAPKAATPTAKPAAKVTAPPKTITYVVKPGDNLSVIAAWFHLNGYDALYRANWKVIGGDPNLIRPGETFTITNGVMSVSH